MTSNMLRGGIMITPKLWFERRFAFELTAEHFPLIVERLRGTSGRLRERVTGLSVEQCTQQLDDRWSIQENVGHLLDLEPLWVGRIEDIQAQKEWLRSADLENTATHQANHNGVPMEFLLAAFREARRAWVEQIEAWEAKAVEQTALHPRLKQPMRIIDLAFFVAEHDDHHLARITALRQMLA